MTLALNTVTANPAYQPYVPTVGQAQTETAATAWSSEAVSLSAESAVVASLGGATAATVYSPSGLLTSLQQAGTQEESLSVPADGSKVDTANSTQFAQDQGIVATLATSVSGSGIYTGSGSASDGLSDQASANWADLLKTNPDLAGTVISSSFDIGIVSTLHVTA